jgi:hypothetical protein
VAEVYVLKAKCAVLDAELKLKVMSFAMVVDIPVTIIGSGETL